MNSQLSGLISFSLVPFTASPSALTITGTVAITGADIEVVYRLQGDIDSLTITPHAARPERRDLLWQTTCLELFLARQGDTDYWEFNLSPAGHWNIYHLEGYRQGLAPEPDYRDLPFQLEQSPQELNLSLRCPLPPSLLHRPHRRTGLAVGITAVVEHGSGDTSYWALLHPGPEADFHDRAGFSIKIP